MLLSDKPPRLEASNPTSESTCDSQQVLLLDGVYGDTPYLIDIDADIESRSVFAAPAPCVQCVQIEETHPSPLARNQTGNKH